MNVVLFLLIGLAVGFGIARATSSPLPLRPTLIVGILGAFAGAFVFGSLIPALRGPLGSIFTAVSGAVILLLLVGFFQRKNAPAE